VGQKEAERDLNDRKKTKVASIATNLIDSTEPNETKMLVSEAPNVDFQ
jgi:hypothetical protein